VRLSYEARAALAEAAFMASQEGEADEIEHALDRLEGIIDEARDDIAHQAFELDHHQQEGATR
jgi:hypothetical protein